MASTISSGSSTPLQSTRLVIVSTLQPAGLYAVEEYLQARYYMFRQVLLSSHPPLCRGRAPIGTAARTATTRSRRPVWYAPDTAFEKVLRKGKLTISEHLEVDDSDVLFHIKQWQRSTDPILKDLSSRFTGRRLFKAIDLDMALDEQADFLAAARDCVSRAGFDPAYYFIEDRASDVPYYNFYTVAGAEPKSHIYVEDGYSRPEIREISEVSDVVRGLATRLRTASSVLSGGSERGRLRALPRHLSEKAEHSKEHWLEVQEIRMARIEAADSENLDRYAQSILEAQKKTWGAPLLNHLLYARRPSIFRGARGMWTGIEASGLIDPRLQALLNRRVAALNGCEF
jgi:HD superfamily phosphohydrolase